MLARRRVLPQQFAAALGLRVTSGLRAGARRLRLPLRPLVTFGPTDFLRQLNRVLDPAGLHDGAARRSLGEQELGGGAPVAEATHLVDGSLAISFGLPAKTRLVAERGEQLLDACGAQPGADSLRVEQRRFGKPERAIRITSTINELGLGAEDSPEQLGPSVAVKPSPRVARSTHSTSSRFAVSGSPARCRAVARSRYSSQTRFMSPEPMARPTPRRSAPIAPSTSPSDNPIAALARSIIDTSNGALDQSRASARMPRASAVSPRVRSTSARRTDIATNWCSAPSSMSPDCTAWRTATSAR